MSKKTINTSQAPEAIGTYSQAMKVGSTVYISGQIPLEPETGMLIDKAFDKQVYQAFMNLKAVCEAAGGGLEDIVKLNIYMIDLSNFATVNNIMAELFNAPYPARAAVEVAGLPKGAQFEVEGIMVLHQAMDI